MCLCLRPCLSSSFTWFAWTSWVFALGWAGAALGSVLEPVLLTLTCPLSRHGHHLQTSWPHLKGSAWDLRAKPRHFNNFFQRILLFFSVTQIRSNMMFYWNCVSLSAIRSKVICFLCDRQSICESLVWLLPPSPHQFTAGVSGFSASGSALPVLLPPASGTSLSSNGGGRRWRSHGNEH